MRAAAAKLERTTLRTSRLLDFCSRKELIAQTGHQPDSWPLVVLKELVDNALDACKEVGVAFRSADHIRHRLGLSWEDLTAAAPVGYRRHAISRAGRPPLPPIQTTEVHHDR